MIENEAPALEPIPTRRDETFVRAAVDISTALFLGHDLELALFLASPQIGFSGKTGEESPSVVNVQGGFVETARIRMGPPAALNMAMNLLHTLVEHGQVDLATIQSNIATIAGEGS